MPFVAGCHGSNKRNLTGGTSTAITVMFFATPIGVVNLHETGKGLTIVTQFHDLLEFMLHEQCGIAGNTQCPRETER
ncbi:hypothetical protein DPPLL_28160 [Desulfofustis limnaeus]|uniref:Uncharacterized protein n=1 Tax=Desulfofustis limnaeus TaxID=2740163 RepID=A0ABN6M6E3_9BACT|nr:hypothetical protein DPPLL_28160 [Desulfofustis limnaeus]